MKNKKILIMLSLLAFMVNAIGFVNAYGILDFLDYAESNVGSFGYNPDDRLTILNVSKSSIEIESPVIKNGTKDVSSYLFSVSTERAYANPVAYWCFDNVSIRGNKFSVELDTTNLNSTDVYYIYAVPVGDFPATGMYAGTCSVNDAASFLAIGTAGKESSVNGEDPCFMINDKIYGEGLYCEGRNSTQNTANNVSIYSIRNISHTYDGNKIKLTWESLADTNIEVFLWNENKNTFEKLGNVNSEKREFIFTAVHDGDHILKFRPSDNSQEIDYTAHYIETKSPEVKPVVQVKPVVVGPKENILYIIFGTVLLYLVYCFVVRKRS